MASRQIGRGRVSALVAAALLLCFAPLANALPPGATVVGTTGGGPVSIATDTVWDGVVVLRNTAYVENGASLTLRPGTVIICFSVDLSTAGIVVTRGSQLFVMGTRGQPVIATSARDVANWSGTVFTGTANNPTDISTVGDPSTGTWQLTGGRWRGITILGNGIISAGTTRNSAGVDNPLFPDVGQFAETRQPGLEGVPADRAFYGGLDDEDDSGTINYLSLRYAGSVIGEGVVSGALTLSGIGKRTDISHVEIMNGGGDGIAVNGGTVDLKYFSVWNVGDDSMDIDQGWRGRAQFGLIVQGSSSGSQGFGIGDNCIEMDGAEPAEANPRTTTAILNLTVVGVPEQYADYAAGAVASVYTTNTNTVGNGATAWRDNARAQFMNCVFLDTGGALIQYDDVENGEGYGGTNNDTQEWSDLWTNNAGSDPVESGSETTSGGAPIIATTGPFDGGALYGHFPQITRPLATTLARQNEVRNSVVFNFTDLFENNNAADPFNDPYDPTPILTGLNWSNRIEGQTRGGGTSGVPIQALTRTSHTRPVNGGVPRVVLIDPRPANDALNPPQSLNVPVGEPFFYSPFKWTGAFSPDHNWCGGWTAADAYGFFPNDFVYQTVEPTAVEIGASQLTFKAEPGKCYLIQCSEDGRDWTTLEQIEDRSGLVTISSEVDVDTNKLYRVVLQ